MTPEELAQLIRSALVDAVSDEQIALDPEDVPTDIVVERLTPVRERTNELLADRAELDRLLGQAADRANEVASATLARVYDAMGLLRRTVGEAP